MSVDSQTLEKPSFHLIAPHAMSGVCSQVGDEGLEAFGSYPLFNRLRPVLIKQLGAHTGADTAVMSPQPPSQNSAALENKAFPIIDLHGQSQEMPLVGDEGLELWCSKAFIYRSNVRAGHFSGGARGGAHAT